MTQLGIELRSPGPLVNTLPITKSTNSGSTDKNLKMK